MHSLRRGIRTGPIDNIAGERRSGPRLDVARAPGGEEKLVRVTLDGLCRRLGGAVYYSQYIDGEVLVVTSASGPAAPPVNDRVPFPHVAHTSAVGESLLAQLDFRGRMDRLSRYEPSRSPTGPSPNPLGCSKRSTGTAPRPASSTSWNTPTARSARRSP